MQTMIGILEAKVMTVVKYGSEAWVLQKADEDLLDVFQRNCLRIFLGVRLTDRCDLRVGCLLNASFVFHQFYL